MLTISALNGAHEFAYNHGNITTTKQGTQKARAYLIVCIGNRTLVAHDAPGRGGNQGCVDNISLIPVLFWHDEWMRNQIEIKMPWITCSYICRNMREITWVAIEVCI